MEKRDELVEAVARKIHESARKVLSANKAIVKIPGPFIEWKDLTEDQRQGKRMMAEDVVDMFFPRSNVNDFGSIDHDFVAAFGSSVLFKIQDGPIKSYGINGCQIDIMIDVVSEIISMFDSKFPCQENKDAIAHLNLARQDLRRRTSNRERRGVEGMDKN